MDSDMKGLSLMSTKPAIRITTGDVPARRPCVVNVVLCGGHLDGLEISKVEVAATWPRITTLERWSGKAADGEKIDLAFIKRCYVVDRTSGKITLDRKRRVRYIIEETS